MLHLLHLLKVHLKHLNRYQYSPCDLPNLEPGKVNHTVKLLLSKELVYCLAMWLCWNPENPWRWTLRVMLRRYEQISKHDASTTCSTYFETSWNNLAGNVKGLQFASASHMSVLKNGVCAWTVKIQQVTQYSWHPADSPSDHVRITCPRTSLNHSKSSELKERKSLVRLSDSPLFANTVTLSPPYQWAPAVSAKPAKHSTSACLRWCSETK